MVQTTENTPKQEIKQDELWGKPESYIREETGCRVSKEQTALEVHKLRISQQGQNSEIEAKRWDPNVIRPRSAETLSDEFCSVLT